MYHNYYGFNTQQLLDSPRLPVIVMKDKPTVFKAIADEMADTILQNNFAGKRTVFICPVGPIGQYPFFVQRVNTENISLKNVWFINMDEYLTDAKRWIDMADVLSFRGFMYRTVYDRIRSELVMDEEQRIFPDPDNPQRISGLIDELGGVDICFGGIGINGHVAFNEADPALSAEEFLELGTRVLKISGETRTANAIGDLHGNIEDMPNYCITVGMKEIFSAKKIRLACFRDWHRSVVRRAAYGEESAQFPVSLLRNHPDITLRITEFVADLSAEEQI